MAYLLRSRNLICTSKPATALRSRAFTCTAMRGLKETDETPDLSEARDRHIKDGLNKQKEGKGHWKPELASDSEEALAADRNEHDDHSEVGIRELQERTKEHAEKKHRHGTSMDPGV